MPRHQPVEGCLCVTAIQVDAGCPASCVSSCDADRRSRRRLSRHSLSQGQRAWVRAPTEHGFESRAARMDNQSPISGSGCPHIHRLPLRATAYVEQRHKGLLRCECSVMASLTVRRCRCCSIPKALGSRESILVEGSALGALSSGTANWGRAFLFSTSNLLRAFSSVKEPALRCHEPCPSSLLHSKAQIPHRPFVPHRLTAGSPMLRHYDISTPVSHPPACKIFLYPT